MPNSALKDMLPVSKDKALSHLATAVKAAACASKILSLRDGDSLAADSVGRRDIKLRADRKSEEVLLYELVSTTGIPAMSEEAGLVGSSHADGLRWVIDPLDGTANYSKGMPFSCVSIALEQNGQAMLGVVHDFARDEVFTGIVGVGAELNGVPISVSNVATSERAIFATGLPARRDYSADALAEFGRSLARWYKVRLLGSAALSLAYVAAGRCDAYSEQSIMPWDVAAGAAIVRAAGGLVRMTPVEGGEALDVVAANVSLLNYLFPPAR